MTYRMNSLDPFYKRTAINDTAGEAPVAQGNESFLIALMCSAVQVMGIDKEDVPGESLNVLGSQVEVVLDGVLCICTIVLTS